MNLIQADELTYNVSRMLYSEVLAAPVVKEWVVEAEKNEYVQLLKIEVERLNIRRSNMGLHWLSTNVFYLLEFDCERHARNKTEQRAWERAQVKAALALAVPHKESSLPWMIYQTLQNKDKDERSTYDKNMEFCARCD